MTNLTEFRDEYNSGRLHQRQRLFWIIRRARTTKLLRYANRVGDYLGRPERTVYGIPGERVPVPVNLRRRRKFAGEAVPITLRL